VTTAAPPVDVDRANFATEPVAVIAMTQRSLVFGRVALFCALLPGCVDAGPRPCGDSMSTDSKQQISLRHLVLARRSAYTKTSFSGWSDSIDLTVR
jgi:hypothetical protein